MQTNKTSPTYATRDPFWQRLFYQFRQRTAGVIGLIVVLIFCFIAIIAPLLAAGKPLFLTYHSTPYFPLFRYLLYPGYYTKAIDLFFNLLLITSTISLLVWLVCYLLGWKRYYAWACLILLQTVGYLWITLFPMKDPAYDPRLAMARAEALAAAYQSGRLASRLETQSWAFELAHLNAYARLNLLLREQQQRWQEQRLQAYIQAYESQKLERWLNDQARSKRQQLINHQKKAGQIASLETFKKEVLEEAQKNSSLPKIVLPTLSQLEASQEKQLIERLQKEAELAKQKRDPDAEAMAMARLTYVKDRRDWINQEIQAIHWEILPLLRFFHWEEDAAGDQNLNQVVSWNELTRVNRKDLLAALVFGARISLVVGIVSVALALFIGVPIGALAGYYGGRLDLLISRLLEIWESMPLFFMLLMVVAILQTKSIFLFITIIGLFSWTGFSRYIRGETLKQKNLPYVEACRSIGYRDSSIIFLHVLPNAIPPLLTLLPFAIMAAISSEAALSFLGLGEEGSGSWGVLMDEGRQAFPAESYLLWPPAILLTLLLIAIALVGDALRDAIDPKMQR